MLVRNTKEAVGSIEAADDGAEGKADRISREEATDLARQQLMEYRLLGAQHNASVAMLSALLEIAESIECDFNYNTLYFVDNSGKPWVASRNTAVGIKQAIDLSRKQNGEKLLGENLTIYGLMGKLRGEVTVNMPDEVYEEIVQAGGTAEAIQLAMEKYGLVTQEKPVEIPSDFKRLTKAEFKTAIERIQNNAAKEAEILNEAIKASQAILEIAVEGEIEGSDEKVLYFRDLETGEVFFDSVPKQTLGFIREQH